MEHLFCYKKMPEWDAATIPLAFQKKHNTKTGSWAKLTIIQGTLDFAFLTEDDEIISTFTFSPENQPPYIVNRPGFLGGSFV